VVSLILLIISVISISCAYIIQYKSPILGTSFTGTLCCDITYFYFDFFGSRNNNVLCRAKKETRHWSIVVCEGYCIQCSFSILDRGSRYRNFLGIIVSQLMVILTYVEIKEIRVL